VGAHRRVAPGHVLGQHQRQGRRLTCGVSGALQRKAHGVGVLAADNYLERSATTILSG
jgi:hypothetical protein